MRLTYDPDAQAAYLYVNEAYRGQRVTTELVPDEIMVDRSPAGDLLGIEMLGVERLVSPLPALTWRHKDAATDIDHPADARHDSTGKWVCFKCREPIVDAATGKSVNMALRTERAE